MSSQINFIVFEHIFPPFFYIIYEKWNHILILFKFKGYSRTKSLSRRSIKWILNFSFNGFIILTKERDEDQYPWINTKLGLSLSYWVDRVWTDTFSSWSWSKFYIGFLGINWCNVFLDNFKWFSLLVMWEVVISELYNKFPTPIYKLNYINNIFYKNKIINLYYCTKNI